MPTQGRSFGDEGEQLACNWYVAHEFAIIDRNVFIKHIGEIDIVAARQTHGGMEYVFAEVKTRSSSNYGFGYEAVNVHKLKKMRQCAMLWLRENGDRNYRWRLDVVSIDFAGTQPEITVFENVD
jgi:putative endonuclease